MSQTLLEKYFIILLGINVTNQSMNNFRSLWFLLVLTLLNFLQAYYMELLNDEAYYWQYTTRVALGYFDHPPMTAWWIALGYSLVPNELGVRLLFVFASSASIYLTFRLLCTIDPELD
jgi:4-amino-4-deoxy-L-arabinose transferase-like glycosyltransferase